MHTLDEHNSVFRNERDPKLAGVLCPQCHKEGIDMEMEYFFTDNILFLTNPPRQQVKCPKCKLIDYKVIG